MTKLAGWIAGAAIGALSMAALAGPGAAWAAVDMSSKLANSHVTIADSPDLFGWNGTTAGETYYINFTVDAGSLNSQAQLNLSGIPKTVDLQLWSGTFATPGAELADSLSVVGPSFENIVSSGSYFLKIIPSISGTSDTSHVSGSLSLSAVPEPATWGLMLVGFGVMGAALRRRAMKAAKVVA